MLVAAGAIGVYFLQEETEPSSDEWAQANGESTFAMGSAATGEGPDEATEGTPHPSTNVAVAGRITREQWDELRLRLPSERDRPAMIGPSNDLAASPENPAPEGRSGPGRLEPEYIQEAIRDMVPLWAECYELAQEQDPSLSGQVIMKFVIGGDPEVGGIVEESTVSEDSALNHPSLNECLRETMYTVEFPAPEASGRLEVTYPLNFSPEDSGESEPE